MPTHPNEHWRSMSLTPSQGPKIPEGPLSPWLQEMVDLTRRYAAAGAGWHRRPLCLKVHAGQPCMLDAAACRRPSDP